MIEEIIKESEMIADSRLNEIIENIISTINNNIGLKEDLEILRNLLNTYVDSKISFHRMKRRVYYSYQWIEPDVYNKLSNKVAINKQKYHEMRDYIEEKYKIKVNKI